MAVRKANAAWRGTLQEGNGEMKFGTFEGPFTWASRFENGSGTNPEELLGAAHAGCFSMSLSSGLGRAGFTPTRIATEAQVHLEKVDGKNTITRIELTTEAVVPGIGNEQFQEIAEASKAGCPVSRALAGVDIRLNARLVQ